MILFIIQFHSISVSFLSKRVLKPLSNELSTTHRHKKNSIAESNGSNLQRNNEGLHVQHEPKVYGELYSHSETASPLAKRTAIDLYITWFPMGMSALRIALATSSPT